MRKNERFIVYSILALLLAAIPAWLLAAPPGPHGPGGPGGPFGHGFHERMADKLGLSEAQREDIRGVFEAYRPQTEQLVADLRDAHQALREQMHAETFDESAIRAASAEMGTIHTELAVLRARMHDEVRQFLTPEQLEEARELRELFGGFGGPHHGHGRWGRGPGAGFGPPEGD